MVTEEEKNLLEERIRKIEKDYAEFVYVVSHDLGAPLRHIGEFSKLLFSREMDDISDDKRQYIKIIQSSTEKMKSMLDGILEISRVNINVSEFLEFDLKNSFNAALEKTIFEFKNLEIIVDKPDFPVVIGSSPLLTTLFLHLLNNAVRFRTPGELVSIDIVIDKIDGFYKFNFVDKGIGIESGYEESIFKLFQQIERDKKGQHVGVGLTLCRKIIELHGGEINCIPRKEGAHFSFSLPLY